MATQHSVLRWRSASIAHRTPSASENWLGRWFFLLIVCLVLTGCGGGGGGNGGGGGSGGQGSGPQNPPPPPPPPPQTFSVGGSVTGLTGTLVLQNNGGDDLQLQSDGSFTFSQELQNGANYFVTVATQPNGQACVVQDGSGTVNNGDVNSVRFNCFTLLTVGGVISGLNGQVTLQNQGGDDLTLSADGPFTFSTPLADGSGYFVSVLTQPNGQECDVNNGAGNLAGANVTSVSVDCAIAAPEISLSSSAPKSLNFSWIEVPGAVEYRLFERLSDPAGFVQIAAIATGQDTFMIEAFLPDKADASYFLQACDASQCSDSQLVAAQSSLTTAIGYFKASNTGSGDRMGGRANTTEISDGRGVALSADGQTLVVGAPGEDSGSTGVNNSQLDESQTDSGAVYVFTKDGAGEWQQTHYIKASNANAGDRFGSDVALSDDGTTLVVSAPGEASDSNEINGNQASNVAPDSGAVYVFVRNNMNDWLQQAYIKASEDPNARPRDERAELFGSSIALSADGNTLAVGSPGEDELLPGAPGSNVVFFLPDVGVTYVFVRDSVGDWSQQSRIASTRFRSEYGTSVALSGDGSVLAIGGPREDSSTTGINGTPNRDLTDSGAVDVYVRDGAGTWLFETFIKASNTGSLDRFGSAVALADDGLTLAVGAIGESSGSIGINGDELNDSSPNSGAVYVFDRAGSSWTQRAYVKPSNTQLSQTFGADVRLTGDGSRLVVGSPLEISNATGIDGDQTDRSASGAGAAYLFERDAAGDWQQIRYVKASNTGFITGENDNFGISLDLSGDGQVLAIGASGEDSSASGIGGDQADNGASNSGAVYLY